MQRKLVLELNEVNEGLVAQYATEGSALHYFLSRGQMGLGIEDSYDSDYLEPWSQWVSAHTGKRCTEHRIKHLGDVDTLHYPQVWDVFPEEFGLVWGCLNSKTPEDHKIVYLPDPWTSSSKPTRNSLIAINKFLQFAVSKRSGKSAFSTLFSYVRALTSIVPSLFTLVRYVDTKLIASLRNLGISCVNLSVAYSVVEYLAFKYAMRMSMEKRPVDVVFFNMVAHAQHYYWNTDRHHIIDFNFRLVEEILQIAKRNYDEVIVYNGLSQEYSGDKETWNSFVPKGGWRVFICEVLNIDCMVVPCMSYDCNLMFRDSTEKGLGIEKLKNSKVWAENEWRNLFLIEPHNEHPGRVFVRLQFYGAQDAEIKLETGRRINSKTMADCFDLVATRTGRHQQRSFAFGDIKPEHQTLSENWEAVNFYRALQS